MGDLEILTFTITPILLLFNKILLYQPINGREISSRLISSLEGQWIWDPRSIGNGIYLYELRDEDGEILNQGKIVIQK
ncbi:MAG: hypothetical protein KDE26_07670 [Bacteroidetes bacterium]|nr:hypothetical protein [Bacteroidota bacterium]